MTLTPRETDEKLAELYHRLYRNEDRQASNDNHLLHLANAEFYYRGRRRVTDMDVGEAIEKVAAGLAELEAYRASDDGTRSYVWEGYAGWMAPHESRSAASALESHDKLLTEQAEIENEVFALERTYTGWSRFFLVTSSPGHIHSSMGCSTCRATTRYGWLPQYSGHAEDEAVAELGPTLCTVCFPSAPVEYTLGKKLTKAQAEKLAA